MISTFDIYTSMLQMMLTNEEMLYVYTCIRTLQHSSHTRSRTSRFSPTRSVGSGGGGDGRLTGGNNTPGNMSTTTLPNLEENETILK